MPKCQEIWHGRPHPNIELPTVVKLPKGNIALNPLISEKDSVPSAVRKTRPVGVEPKSLGTTRCAKQRPAGERLHDGLAVVLRVTLVWLELVTKVVLSFVLSNVHFLHSNGSS